MDEGDVSLPLTLHERGVSGRPTAFDRLMKSPQWKAAKARVNPETGREFSDQERNDGAMYIVGQLWSASQTEELRRRLDGKEPVFITMPSTTGQNLLPIALGQVLQGELGGWIIDGGDIAKAVHYVAMKDVPVEQRPFVPREYVLKDPDGLRQSVAGKAVVVVEDVFSSGASAKAFCDSLSESKIQVTTVAGLLGDSRLSSEPQLVGKLAKTLKHAEIDLKAKDITQVLSRGQVTTLIDIVNSRGKHEYDAIAKGIRGVLDSRAARYLGQDSWRWTQGGGFGHHATKDIGREGAGVGIPSQSGSQGSGGHDSVDAGESGESLKEKMRQEMQVKRLEEVDRREEEKRLQQANDKEKGLER